MPVHRCEPVHAAAGAADASVLLPALLRWGLANRLLYPCLLSTPPAGPGQRPGLRFRS